MQGLDIILSRKILCLEISLLYKYVDNIINKINLK